MVSSEFQSSIAEKNLLLARIILKDSMVIDPTFKQFDEMLLYAKARFPEIMVPFDNEPLENDIQKWDIDQMNAELVLLVRNFSDNRILHLKKLISTVRARDIQKLRAKRIQKSAQLCAEEPNAAHSNGIATAKSPEEKLRQRRKALQQMVLGGNQVKQLIIDVQQNGRGWTPAEVESMESAARQILEATKIYNDNR